MNRDSSLQQKIVWHKMHNQEVAFASFDDDGTIPASEIMGCISTAEKAHAATVQDTTELRHYIARRAFQRIFLCSFLSTDVKPNKLSLIHQRDTQPHCAEAPGLNLSFSTSGTTAIACASWHTAVGIDIERLRKIENVIALAKRFFTAEEAETLAIGPEAQQSLAFLHYWTAKEASLKAIGKGVVFGLNTFRLVEKGPFSYSLQGPPEISQDYNLYYLDNLPQYLIALVQMNRVGKI